MFCFAPSWIDPFSSQMSTTCSQITNVDTQLATMHTLMLTISQNQATVIERLTPTLDPTDHSGSQTIDCGRDMTVMHRPKVIRKRKSDSTGWSISVSAWWLNRVYTFQLQRCYGGWDHSFRSYCIVSGDSHIFECVRSGDVAELQHLFTSGHASPYMMDDEGYTLLHVCNKYHISKGTV